VAKNNQTKEQILETAYKLFRDEGYNNVSVSEICEVEGISPTTFYYHFPTKEDLINKFFEQPPAVSVAMFEKILAAENCWKQLWLLTEYALKHYFAMGPEILKQVIESNLNGNKGTFDEPNEALMNLSIPLVIKGQQAGEIRNLTEAKELIRTGWLLQFGMLTNWCIAKGKFDLRKAVLDSQEILYDIDPATRIKL
jgi:AcrR family transcriptional regulator